MSVEVHIEKHGYLNIKHSERTYTEREREGMVGVVVLFCECGIVF